MAQIINPASCKCTGIVSNPNPCPAAAIASCSCIEVCNILIGTSNSVLPCNVAGSVDITSAFTLPCSNCDSPVFSIISISDNLKNVSINATTVNFTSDWQTGDSSYDVGTIVFQIKCDLLVDQGTITILFKRAGEPNDCTATQTYNPCTGVCDDNGPDLVID